MNIKKFYSLKKTIKHSISQVVAITEKNIKLELRFKFKLIFDFINPIILSLIPFIIFNKFFSIALNQNLGPWTPSNYIVFVLSSYNLSLLKKLINTYPHGLRQEKFWKTLPALIMAPFNRFNLLLGIFFSHIIMISIPFLIFFIITLILYPISLSTIIFVLVTYLLIALTFSGIGLLVGVFAISMENIWRSLIIALNLIFWASCLSFPFDIFPSFAKPIIYLNPFYHIFFFLRMSWIQNNPLLTISVYWYDFTIVLLFVLSLPIISVFIFNKIYRKYGIVGY